MYNNRKIRKISAKLLEMLKGNELGAKCVSFQWTTLTGTMNAIRMNHCDKEDLRFEALKRTSFNDTIEHEREL